MSKASLISLCKRDLLDIYKHAIESVRPDNLIKSCLVLGENKLTVKDPNNGCEVSFDIEKSGLHLVGGGKSVLSMAHGIAQLANQAGVTHRFSGGCLSLPVGLRGALDDNVAVRDQLKSIGVRCLFGARDNLPDEDSIKASQAILDGVKSTCGEPLFIVLVSGGGSACLTSPRFLNLSEKLKLIRFLVQKGANIVELNMVRRYFSHIKGGQLARHILGNNPNSRILTLILSDVIGDPVEYIASGPTYLASDGESSTHRETMLRILRKYGYHEDDLSHLLNKISLDDADLSLNYDNTRILNLVVGNNKVALNASVRRAQKLKYHVEIIDKNLEGSSNRVMERICQLGRQVFDRSRGRVLVIGGGEATVNKLEGETWGKGGRAQEMALDYMIAKLSSTESAGENSVRDSTDVFMAASTDGQDGPTDVAACVASLADLVESGAGKDLNLSDLRRAKKEHDSYNFWSRHKPDWLVKTGLTGTNVMDLYMYLLHDGS